TRGHTPPGAIAPSGAGDAISSAIRFTNPQSMTVTGRNAGASPSPRGPQPPRYRAISSNGRCVADRPIRCGGDSHNASRRSSDNARCAPRFVPATAWISSTITARTVARVARPHRDANLGERLPRLLESQPQLRERHLEVAMDVVAQRLERRDVEDLYCVRQRRVEAALDEAVDLPQKRRQRLARPGRRQNQGVRPARNRRPPQPLWIARPSEGVAKPLPHDPVERAHERSIAARGHPQTYASRWNAGRNSLATSRQQPHALAMRNRIAVVTGIGRKGQTGEIIARTLAEAGMQIIAVARHADEAQARVDDLRSAGHEAQPFACDLSDEAQVATLARDVATAAGSPRVDVLVNIARGFAM